MKMEKYIGNTHSAVFSEPFVEKVECPMKGRMCQCSDKEVCTHNQNSTHNRPLDDEEKFKKWGVTKNDSGISVTTSPLDVKEEGCDGECHFQAPYGFVPHAGCPLHDRMTEEERKDVKAPWEEEFRSFWQTNRENNKKYAKCKAFIRSLLTSEIQAALEKQAREIYHKIISQPTTTGLTGDDLLYMEKAQELIQSYIENK
jgi:hypothetical protein